PSSPVLLSRWHPTGSNNITLGSAGLAVDGNLTNHVLSGLCIRASPTAGLPYVHWLVSLGEQKIISHIFIVDMVESLASVQQTIEEMQSVSVFVGNSTDTSLASIVETWTGGFMKSHIWNVEVDRIASVAGLLKPATLGGFSFCEFEIYGYPNIAAYYYINSAIGLEDGRVQVTQLGVGQTAPVSPFDGFSHPTPFMAALNRPMLGGLPPAAFFPTVGTTEIFLEVQLDVTHMICGLVWQGSGVFSDLAANGTNSYNAFVATAEIFYGNSTKSLQAYSVYGALGLSTTIGTGLTDSITPHRMSLSSPFLAKVVRLLPKASKNLRLLRFELLGYPEDCNWLDSSEATVSAVSSNSAQILLSSPHVVTGWRLTGGSGNATFSLSFISLRNGSLQTVFNCSLGSEQYLPLAVYTTKLFINFSDPAQLSTAISLRGCRMA
uniref:CUB domain-containing protein n=1 Tax=Macrostomum lignano TaxID=282301 RepID=A0A1I8G5W4_9PLAT